MSRSRSWPWVPLALLLLLACPPPSATSPQPGAVVRLPPPNWRPVARLLDSLIADGSAPGAVVAVSYHGLHWYHGTGRLGQDDATVPDSATVYDLASLTKVIGLTPAVMLGVAENRFSLDDPLARYLPEFISDSLDLAERRAVTLRHLLTHSSGLPAWRALYQESPGREAAFQLATSTALDTLPGTRFVYSDLGAILLTRIVERRFVERLDSLLGRRIFAPLGMRDTRYLPPTEWLPRIAPTELDPWRGRTLRGEVHDENAARLDGVSGHAGLFSSARDLLRFADWMLASGQREPGTGKRAPERLVSEGAGNCPSTSPDIAPGSGFPVPGMPVSQFTTRQDLPPGSSRALGWDTPSGESSAGHLMSRESFGHTGFTGTSIWVDPTRCLAVVLLSNRVHPSRTNQRWGPARALIADAVVAQLPDSPGRR